MIPALIGSRFPHRSVVFGCRRSLGNCLLVTTEPSIPAVLLWNNPTPDHPLSRFTQVFLITQDRVRIPQFVDLQNGMALGEYFRSRTNELVRKPPWLRALSTSGV